MEQDAEQFIKLLFETEAKYDAQSQIPTDVVIELVEIFNQLYRSANIHGHLNDWRNFSSSFSEILVSWVYSNSEIDAQQLKKLLRYQNQLSATFKASYDFEQRRLYNKYNQSQRYKQNLTKLLLTSSINNLNDELFDLYVKSDPSLAIYLAIGWLSERTIITRNAAMYHQKIVDNFDRFSECTVELEYIPEMCRAYMYTSYSASANKDEIKATINKVIRNSFAAVYNLNQIEVNNKRKLNRKIKNLTIVHERFSSTHVMLRIYKSVYLELEKIFNVTHVSWKTDNIEKLRKIFKNVKSSDDRLGDVLNNISSSKPDIILYPSIGMSSIGVVLSTFRLAPVQLQMFGHPSSSHSPVIDGSIIGSLSHKNTGNEKLDRFEGYKEGVWFPPSLYTLTEEIRYSPVSVLTKHPSIAINAKILKLNPNFISFLETLKLPKDTIFHFFPAEKGTEYISASNFLSKRFPKCIVHPIYEYEEFIRKLSLCDLSICPFPFGNTNGIQDCFYLGLPVCALKGEEICSSPETQLLNTAGLNEFLFSKPEDMAHFIENFFNSNGICLQTKDKVKLATEKLRLENDVDRAAKHVADSIASWVKGWADNKLI